MNSRALSVKGVTHRFGAVTAVDSLSFEVGRGEIFGLLGPNGAGKTTTIHLITGLLRPGGGSVDVMGHDPRSHARQVRRMIGYVPQETNVYLDLNALDNLRHHAALYCRNLKGLAGHIEELLELMSLWERRKDPVRTFSGGMKRRLVLARALLHDPEIILFDEPTLGVDVQARHVIWDHIKTRRRNGTTFIVTTNDMTEADTLCDRLLIIDTGRAVALDTPEQFKADLGRDIVTIRTTPVIEEPETFFSGLGLQDVSRSDQGLIRLEVRDAGAIVGELVARIGTAYRLESVRIARPTLDDVFLHHTGRALRE